MRFRRWAAFAALCSVFGLLFVLGPVNTDEARAYEAEEQRFLELINEYRQANGLGPLALSEKLSKAAERHSEDMQTHDFFSHTTEASSYYPVGSSFSDRLAREGYPTDTAYTAENIALGYTTAEEVFEAWRNSPSHNVNMLGKNYTAIGIGQVGTYWTTDFGSVADSAPSVSEPQKPSGETETPATKQAAAPQTPAEPETIKPETTEQTLVTRPQANQSTIEPTSSEQAQDAEVAPDAEPDEEAALQTASSTSPAAEDSATEQSNAEETLTAETAQPSDGEQAIKEPADAETNAQASEDATSVEEDDQESSATDARSTEDEAAETASAETASAEDEAAEVATAEAVSEDAARGADSDRDAPGKAPTAMKELPRTGGAPLPLLLGAILLLNSLLVHGIVRKRRML